MPLYIISTPIGNLKDITLRAIETLQRSDLILAEDTRRTSILLNRYKITNKQLTSFNDNNKEKKTPTIIQELKQDKQISLVSDSGTPGVSDPGFYLIREAIKDNIKIIPIPGPTASITALIASGFPTDEFQFYGFLPKKEKAKKDLFKKIKQEQKTTILYESPYRLLKTIKAMQDIFPNKQVCIARELTKKFEEFIRGTPLQLYQELQNKNIKGEITIILSK